MPRDFDNKTVLEGLIDARASARNSVISDHATAVTAFADSINAPQTASVKEMNPKRDVMNYSSDASVAGILVEREETEAGWRQVIDFASGGFEERYDNGDRVNHVSKDDYLIIEGSFLIHTEGDKVEKVDGRLALQVDDAIMVRRGGTYVVISDSGVSLSTDVSISVVTTADTNINVSGSTTVTCPQITLQGGQVTIEGGSPAPTQDGPFCAIPNCIFSGAPHRSANAPS